MTNVLFDGVRVFSVTLRHERGQIGEAITAWLAASKVELVEIAVRQSSDAAYHCLSFVLFYRDAARPTADVAAR